MNFTEALDSYLARHWRNMEQDTFMHLKALTAHMESKFHDWAGRSEETMEGHAAQIREIFGDPAAAPELAAEPPVSEDDLTQKSHPQSEGNQ